jgi:hypothetical protein
MQKTDLGINEVFISNSFLLKKKKKLQWTSVWGDVVCGVMWCVG